MREHELRAAVGLFPLLGQRIKLRFNRVRCRRQGYVTRLPTLREQLQRRDEFIARLLQLLERLGAADEPRLRRLGDALGQHAHLRGSGNIDRAVSRFAVVLEHDECGRDEEHRKYRAENRVLPADADRSGTGHPPLRPFEDGRRAGRRPCHGPGHGPRDCSRSLRGGCRALGSRLGWKS